MLAAWRASPDRFREDANAEDDLAFGGYRDRLLVELAQNASDAADGDGRLDIRTSGKLLTAANTGRPLDAAGVRGLASLRASGKRSGATVGRFGVGFAAVAAVSDEVVIASTTGAVRFARSLTADLLADEPTLAAELAARQGRVPLLRLPFAAEATPRRGFATEVIVTLRADATVAPLEDELLLFLPGLSEICVDGRVLQVQREDAGVVLAGTRWVVAEASGKLDPVLLESRPVEERAASRWQVTWAVPVGADAQPLPPTAAAVLRAPTPTDDPLSSPALLAATLPLGPDRRRVAPGPLAEAVLAQAAEALPLLLAQLADDPARLLFVPGPVAAGEVDAILQREVLRVLRTTPFLAGRLPRDAVVLDGATSGLLDALTDVLPGLLPSSWGSTRWTRALQALGVRRVDLAELTQVLTGLQRPPAWWRDLYAELPPDAEALGALPVPLSDGRMAPSPRGLLMSSLGIDLSPLGFRLVHPDAAHPLLARLGAVEQQPESLLADPRVRAAVEAAAEEEDPSAISTAVTELVAAAGVRPGELPWLATLPLRDSDGDWRPAGELLLPGGALAAVVDVSAGFGFVAPTSAPDDVLRAIGVLDHFAVVPVDEADGADGLEEWLAELPAGSEPGLVVRDLDLVRPDAWPAALDLLRRKRLDELPYVRWWLARSPVSGNQHRRVPGSDPLLVGLYDEAATGVPGAFSTVADAVRSDPGELLRRLADPSRTVERDQCRAVHAALAAANLQVSPPSHVRAVVAGSLAVVPADDAVIVDRPDLLPLVTPYAVVPVPLALAPALADLLDVALASEVVTLPTALVARTAGGEDVELAWAVNVEETRDIAGAARASAWERGSWEARHAIEAQLLGTADAAEGDLDPA
ncbi:MAG TPA: ATP-binding protein [Mycobacteriales bacterium]|nr:ATP-binding protein [Mycobacteriales bacterium]